MKAAFKLHWLLSVRRPFFPQSGANSGTLLYFRKWSRGKKPRRSKGIRLNPFDTCSLSNTTSELQTLEQQPQQQGQILRPNWVRVTVTLVLHIYTLLSTNLSANLSSLQGNVLAGPQKSEQFPETGRAHSEQLDGYTRLPHTTHSAASAFRRRKGRSGQLARAQVGYEGF